MDLDDIKDDRNYSEMERVFDERDHQHDVYFDPNKLDFGFLKCDEKLCDIPDDNDMDNHNNNDSNEQSYSSSDNNILPPLIADLSDVTASKSLRSGDAIPLPEAPRVLSSESVPLDTSINVRGLLVTKVMHNGQLAHFVMDKYGLGVVDGQAWLGTTPESQLYPLFTWISQHKHVPTARVTRKRGAVDKSLLIKK